MSERKASTTAVLVCQGRAVAHGRLGTGRFSDPVARDLLDPDERVVVDLVRAGRAPSGAAEWLSYDLVRRTALTMVPRTVAIDAAVVELAAAQVVVLGAGLDARAWRMPELAGATVFEVDHPASQQDARRRVGDRPARAARVVWVPVDLATDDLATALCRVGFEPSVPTTWVWEGVVPYLTRSAVASTVGELADLSAPGSRVVVTYQTTSVRVAVLRQVARLALRVARRADPLAGEPWRSTWRPDGIRKLFDDNGFSVLADDDLLTLSAGVEGSADNVESLRNGRVGVAVRR